MIKITYVCHSGFLAELEDAYFLFDYYKGELPEMNAAKKLFVFASHAHYDHFQKSIFRLRGQFPQAVYVLSDDIKTEETENVRFVGANQQIEAAGCQIRTLCSTDEGVAFLLNYQGKTIYHAGDLNWWHWEEEGEEYNAVMKRNYQDAVNKIRGEQIDVAFVPVDPRLEKQYCWGLDYFMRHTDTKAVFPMHFWRDYRVFERLKDEPCVKAYADRIQEITREGQQFVL